jgi:hypothetical protein
MTFNEEFSTAQNAVQRQLFIFKFNLEKSLEAETPYMQCAS